MWAGPREVQGPIKRSREGRTEASIHAEGSEFDPGLAAIVTKEKNRMTAETVGGSRRPRRWKEEG